MLYPQIYLMGFFFAERGYCSQIYLRKHDVSSNSFSQNLLCERNVTVRLHCINIISADRVLLLIDQQCKHFQGSHRKINFLYKTKIIFFTYTFCLHYKKLMDLYREAVEKGFRRKALGFNLKAERGYNIVFILLLLRCNKKFGILSPEC